MTLLLQSGETEYTTTTEEQRTVKPGPKDFLLEQAAELHRSATFYRERAQQFERFIRSPHKLPPLVRQDEEVPRPKRDDPTWLNSWYGYYWRAMNKATSRAWQAERLERQHQRALLRRTPVRKEVFLVVRRIIMALTMATVPAKAVAGPALAGVGTSPG